MIYLLYMQMAHFLWVFKPTTTFALERVRHIVQLIFLFSMFNTLDSIVKKEPLLQMGIYQPFLECQQILQHMGMDNPHLLSIYITVESSQHKYFALRFEIMCTIQQIVVLLILVSSIIKLWPTV